MTDVNGPSLLSLDIRYERDVVLARQRARLVAEVLGLDSQEQTRIATACSEIARNAFRYAGGGCVDFNVQIENPASLIIEITDKGPGIPSLQKILDGLYRSDTGMGMGIIGSRRLMDSFEITTKAGSGTRVVMEKRLPKQLRPLRFEDVKKKLEAAIRSLPEDFTSEVQRQNRELMLAMEQLSVRQAELERLNRELDETNRGVVALYAELDERAVLLQRTSELKSRFLSNMSHEFRTPLNSIISLSNLLLDRIDGPLQPEQEKQVTFIRRSAEGLLEMVNDLLDIAKIEAGKVNVRVEQFTIEELFGALRGMLRPLISSSSVNLYFDSEENLPPLVTDQSKLSQILRNFISNALKFTEKGEVRVSARVGLHDTIELAVADTGIGIAPEDQERIFEEFTQIDSELQRKQKGTGLGLPLTAKLAELLGGRVSVASKLGAGSTFAVVIPRVFPQSEPKSAVQTVGLHAEHHGLRALIVDDDEISRYVLRSLVNSFSLDVVEADGGRRAMEFLKNTRPDVIFLDLMMPGYTGFEMLRDLKSDDELKDIPVIIHTSKLLTLNERELLLKDAVAIIPKASDSRETSTERVRGALERAGLHIDERK